jgi:hypothetical protein
MKKQLLAIAILLFASCKTQQKATTSVETVVATLLKKNEVVEKIYESPYLFSTLNMNANVKFDNGKSSQRVTADIRIKKDEKILITVKFLGFTMAKALITPTKVSYYEKIKGTYFDGDFSGLSQWLGTDLDYQKVQNMITGQPIDDLKQGQYSNELVDNNFMLDELSTNLPIKKTFYIDANKYWINQQTVSQSEQLRSIDIQNRDFKSYPQANIPMLINIMAQQADNKTLIEVQYGNINFDETINFPYSVPDGYTQVIIK